MKRKRDIDKVTQDFRGRMAWLESAWNCRTEYEIDTSTGELWLKITFPDCPTALVIRCDVAGITVPGTDPRA
jgi:hypothetical protein